MTTWARAWAILAAGLCVVVAGERAAAQNPVSRTIVYQGRLLNGGQPAAGSALMYFEVFSAATGGTVVAQVGTPTTPVTVPLDDGRFTVSLPFNTAQMYDGKERWLQIHVRDGQNFVALSPRQRLAPAPFANYALDIPAPFKGFEVLPGYGPVYSGSANVGIGVTNPVHRLHIGGNGGTGLLGMRISNSSTQGHWDLVVGGTGNSFPGGLAIADESVARLVITEAGNVGVGTTTPERKLDVNGWARVHVFEVTGGSDVSEAFQVNADRTVEPGMVVCIDPERPGELRLSDGAYDRTVAGVVSGAGGISTGMMLRQAGSIADGAHAVALTGRVYAWVDADANGAVRPGDMLTTSPTPGHAMRVDDHARAAGAVIGKAMSPLESGRGLVLVLVNLQ